MATERFGAVDLVAIGVPGEGVPVGFATALAHVADSGSVTLLDLAVVHRHEDGSSTLLEAHELGPEDPLTMLPLAAAGLVGDKDLDQIADATPTGCATLVVLLENTWARDLVRMGEEHDAFVVASERIPAEVVNQIVELAVASS
jgi:hypothetical protein